MSRTPLSKMLRFEVFKRDGFTCQYCGATPPGVLLHVDHILAVAAGGGNEMDNLVTACEPCNLGKGARDLKAAPQSLADRAADTAEREAQLLGFQAIMQARADRIEDEAWSVIRMFRGEDCDTCPRNELISVKRFVDLLGVHNVREAAEIAMSSYVPTSRVFRYFCGICWNRIRGGDQ